MKKVLFYSLAIAAAITSCTQEAIEAPVNNVQDLSVRPTLGEVVLTEDADLMSRFATGSGAQAKFEENDKLGAAIMDKPLYTDLADYEAKVKAEEDLYKIVDYYSSNSAFTYDGSAWYLNEDQPLVEGNYLFYAPYNAAMQLRTPFVVAVPEKQDASAEKAALDEYYASGAVVKVGYQFLAADNGKAQKPKVSMQDVMAYPKFTFKNNFNGYISKLDKDGKQTSTVDAYTGKLVVDSIKFVNATGKALTIGGALDNEKVAEVLTKEWSVSPMENYTAQLIGDAETVDADDVITTLKVGGKELAKGAATSLYAVMPAYQFKANELEVKVYVTIDGKPYVLQNVQVTYTKSSETGHSVAISKRNGNLSYTSSVETVTLIKGQRYPQEELNFEDGKLSTKSSAGNILTLDVKGGIAKSNNVKKVGDTQVTDVVIAQEIAVEVEKEEQVTDLIDNNTEFIAFFKDQLNGSALSENTTDKIEGTKFAFGKNHTVAINSELIDALFTYNNKGTITINSALPIADDVTVELDGTYAVKFTSANENTYVITLGTNYSTADGILKSVIKSNEFASVYVTKDGAWAPANGTIVGNINNYGTVTVAADVTLEAESFANNSKATIEVSGNIVNAVTNNGKITIGASTAVLSVNAGTGSIEMAEDNASDNIYVTAAEHTGIFVATELTKAKVKAAEAYSWVNELDVTAVSEVEFTEEVLAEIKDITAVHVNNVKFDMGTFDMGGLTLCMDASAAMTITGKTKTQTTVNNVVINNETKNVVTLINIAANGTYTGTAKKLATNAATWNGAAIEEGK